MGYLQSYLHPQAKYLHEKVCFLDLWGQHARGPRVREGGRLPPVGGGQGVYPLRGLQHGLRRQVVLGHQVN